MRSLGQEVAGGVQAVRIEGLELALVEWIVGHEVGTAEVTIKDHVDPAFLLRCQP